MHLQTDWQILLCRIKALQQLHLMLTANARPEHEEGGILPALKHAGPACEGPKRYWRPLVQGAFSQRLYLKHSIPG